MASDAGGKGSAGDLVVVGGVCAVVALLTWGGWCWAGEDTRRAMGEKETATFCDCEPAAVRVLFGSPGAIYLNPSGVGCWRLVGSHGLADGVVCSMVAPCGYNPSEYEDVLCQTAGAGWDKLYTDGPWYAGHVDADIDVVCGSCSGAPAATVYHISRIDVCVRVKMGGWLETWAVGEVSLRAVIDDYCPADGNWCGTWPHADVVGACLCGSGCSGTVSFDPVTRWRGQVLWVGVACDWDGATWCGSGKLDKPGGDYMVSELCVLPATVEHPVHRLDGRSRSKAGDDGWEEIEEVPEPNEWAPQGLFQWGNYLGLLPDPNAKSLGFPFMSEVALNNFGGVNADEVLTKKWAGVGEDPEEDPNEPNEEPLGKRRPGDKSVLNLKLPSPESIDGTQGNKRIGLPFFRLTGMPGADAFVSVEAGKLPIWTQLKSGVGGNGYVTGYGWMADALAPFRYYVRLFCMFAIWLTWSRRVWDVFHI